MSREVVDGHARVTYLLSYTEDRPAGAGKRYDMSINRESAARATTDETRCSREQAASRRKERQSSRRGSERQGRRRARGPGAQVCACLSSRAATEKRPSAPAFSDRLAGLSPSDLLRSLCSLHRCWCPLSTPCAPFARHLAIVCDPAHPHFCRCQPASASTRPAVINSASLKSPSCLRPSGCPRYVRSPSRVSLCPRKMLSRRSRHVPSSPGFLA